MPNNDWKIRRGDVKGGPTGNMLDGCEIRKSLDGKAYEFIAVLSRTDGDDLPIDNFKFLPFAYRDLIWDVRANIPKEPSTQIDGTWTNNAKSSLMEDESGTYTAQSGPGTYEEECTVEGKEDAASASA